MSAISLQACGRGLCMHTDGNRWNILDTMHMLTGGREGIAGDEQCSSLLSSLSVRWSVCCNQRQRGQLCGWCRAQLTVITVMEVTASGLVRWCDNGAVAILAYRNAAGRAWELHSQFYAQRLVQDVKVFMWLVGRLCARYPAPCMPACTHKKTNQFHEVYHGLHDTQGGSTNPMKSIMSCMTLRVHCGCTFTVTRWGWYKVFKVSKGQVGPPLHTHTCRFIGHMINISYIYVIYDPLPGNLLSQSFSWRTPVAQNYKRPTSTFWISLICMEGV